MNAWQGTYAPNMNAPARTTGGGPKDPFSPPVRSYVQAVTNTTKQTGTKLAGTRATPTAPTPKAQPATGSSSSLLQQQQAEQDAFARYLLRPTANIALEYLFHISAFRGVLSYEDYVENLKPKDYPPDGVNANSPPDVQRFHA